MNSAALSRLKAHLSDYLTQVNAGAEVLTTDRGKLVA